MIRSLFLLSFLLLGTSALAEEPVVQSKPIVLVTTAMSYGMNLTSLDPLPPTIIHGVGMLIPLRNGWGYYSEVALATSLSEFQPSFQTITGPSRRTSSHLTIGATGMYKLVPSFSGATPPTHIVGLSVAAIFPTAFGSVSIPCGVGYSITANDPSLSCSIKASIHPK